MPLLHDGREVASDSEEWRAECEAREVLSWPLTRRREYMYGTLKQRGVGQIRGEDALRKLETDMMALWKKQKQAA